jgi:hypothetical protein
MSAGTECANCGTVRRPLKARQLCGLCYYAQGKLEQANEETAHGFVEGYKKEWQRRLKVLRINELDRKNPSGLDVEHKLVWLARRAGVPRGKLSRFRGLATLINEHFKPEQKEVLYGLLSDIQEDVPWAGVDWAKVVSGSCEN